MKPVSAFVCVLSDVQMLAFLLVFHLGINFLVCAIFRFSRYYARVLQRVFTKSFLGNFQQPHTGALPVSHLALLWFSLPLQPYPLHFTKILQGEGAYLSTD